MFYTTSNGNNCPSSGVVLTEADCKHAANQLAMSYRYIKNGEKYPAGCNHYDKRAVYFNNIVDPSKTSPYSIYGAICSTSTGMVILVIFFKEALL